MTYFLGLPQRCGTEMRVDKPHSAKAHIIAAIVTIATSATITIIAVQVLQRNARQSSVVKASADGDGLTGAMRTSVCAPPGVKRNVRLRGL